MDDKDKLIEQLLDALAKLAKAMNTMYLSTTKKINGLDDYNKELLCENTSLKGEIEDYKKQLR